MNNKFTIKKISNELAAAGIENARGEAKIIFEEFSSASASDAEIFAALERRKTHEPLQYILKKAWFYGNTFEVGPGVLIPRPETELLVEAALEQPFESFLDWGTGSGCIAATLLCERANTFGIAAEKNPRSILIAWKNFRRLRLLGRCLLWHSQAPSDIPARGLDLVISNPPYIKKSDIETLMPEVKHEPEMALDGGGEGLDFYRPILKFAPIWLRRGGRLLFEIGYGQKEFFADGSFDEMKLRDIRPDYAGIPRVVCYEKI